MNQSIEQNTQAEIKLAARQKRRGQIAAILIMSIVLLPMTAAYIIYHTGFGMPKGTANKGVLMTPPVALPELALRSLEGELWDINANEKKWRYIIPGFSTCDATCEENLYLTRQVHIRLGNKAGRVERIYLLLDNNLAPEFREQIKAEHPRLKILQADSQAWKALVANTNVAGDTKGRYFLTDQKGFMMMAYNKDHDGAALLKDIKKMLKTTYEN